MIEPNTNNLARETLNKGSKSFDFATRFFPKEAKESVYDLYAWCRNCDDITDGSKLGYHQNPVGLSKDRVKVLGEKTRLAIKNSHAPIEPFFIGFGRVVNKYQIPEIYSEDLLKGFEQDAQTIKIKTTEDLLLYCYRVAGTVGLMMCHVMGLKNSRALKNAVDLGIALQLTNIARDIRDDFSVGRVYIPTDWLQEAGIPIQELMNPHYSIRLRGVVKRLLTEAEGRYYSGLRGLIDLPWRPALAVAIATYVYKAIGTRIKKKGYQTWDVRVSTGKLEKGFAAIQGVILLLKSIPQRILNPRPTISTLELWRYE